MPHDKSRQAQILSPVVICFHSPKRVSPKTYPLDGYVVPWYLSPVIKLRLNELLQERGHTVYWLWKKTGVRYATIWQLNNGEAARLNIDSLDLICEALECQPGDLLVRIENPTGGKRGK
jgi:putative transcriptional regulator